ncbi:MAG: hypothetical protein ACKV2T_06245 [Kofleriaceae bacterium]
MTRLALLAILLVACSGDGTEADRLGIGAQCTESNECDTEMGQSCLAFKGGYCGEADCLRDTDCPDSSACIAHDDGTNYCFRTCIDKAECNANRDPENEANCSSNVTFVDGDMGRKACVPPSGS